MSTARLRVLIVDDHPGVVKALTRLLMFEFDVVGSVADADGIPEAVQRLRPDVIVLDMNLPNVGGLDACRDIKAAAPQAQVVIFTAMDDPELRQRALEAGATAFVNKLAVDGELLSTLRRLRARDD